MKITITKHADGEEKTSIQMTINSDIRDEILREIAAFLKCCGFGFEQLLLKPGPHMDFIDIEEFYVDTEEI